MLKNNNDVFLRVFKKQFENAKKQAPNHPLIKHYEDLIEFMDGGGDREQSTHRVTAMMMFLATAGAVYPPSLSNAVKMASVLQPQVKPIVAELAQEKLAQEKLEDPNVVLPQA